MVGRELASRFFEDRTRPRTTVRPSVRTLTFYVLSYACAQRRRHTTPRPPHVMFLTRPSPSLVIFIVCYVAHAEEGLGTRLTCSHVDIEHCLNLSFLLGLFCNNNYINRIIAKFKGRSQKTFKYLTQVKNKFIIITILNEEETKTQ